MDTDYIVVGSGIAGLRAALELAPAGRVTIFTKAEITESNPCTHKRNSGGDWRQ